MTDELKGTATYGCPYCDKVIDPLFTRDHFMDKHRSMITEGLTAFCSLCPAMFISDNRDATGRMLNMHRAKHHAGVRPTWEALHGNDGERDSEPLDTKYIDERILVAALGTQPNDDPRPSFTQDDRAAAFVRATGLLKSLQGAPGLLGQRGPIAHWNAIEVAEWLLSGERPFSVDDDETSVTT
jgi:hypothetical protein